MMIRKFNGSKMIAMAIAVILTLSHAAAAQTTDTTTDESSTTNPYNYKRFTPSMAILLVIFASIVFVMGFFAIYLRHCSLPARSTLGTLPIATRRSNQPGLDPTILSTFPSFSYSEVKSHKIGKGALECAVCLTEFADEETLRLLPICDHVFHQDCIDIWLASHTTCPVCRAKLDEPASQTARRIEYAPERPVNGSNNDQQVNEISDLLQLVTKNAPRIKDENNTFSKFPKSNSTGHCLVQPGENVDRFTLRLPSEIRNQIINRRLSRSTSVVVLPTVNSLRKGYRDESSGSGDGMDRIAEARWWWSGLFVKNGSSVKPSFGGEGTSRAMGIDRQMSRMDRSGSIRDNANRPAV